MQLDDGFTAHGEVRLTGAHIGGQLDLRAGRAWKTTNGTALTADGLTVDQVMFCRDGFIAAARYGWLRRRSADNLTFDRCEPGKRRTAER